MPDDVTLVGLDFGTTTSGAVVATANLATGAATGRLEFGPIHECFRSERVFTPLAGDDRLDERAMEQLLDAWLTAGNVRSAEVFGGGAMLTGLTAQKQNAPALIQLIRSRLGNALVATADDPRLESWLAFMGNCAGLSRAHPDQPVLNFDIGGGTTNLAVGLNGQVLQTGCCFVGARHVQVVPGTYQIVRLSCFAHALFDELRIGRDVGDSLTATERDAILDFYVSLLEAAACERSGVLQQPLAQLHIQVPFRLPANVGDVRITFSGGVGELVYDHVEGKPWPSQSCFGDLGIDLARRILDSPFFAPHLRGERPASAGRATVYGLLRYATEISGSTVFLPRPAVLPLTDMPIFGRLDADATDDRIRNLLELVRHSARGGCVQLVVAAHNALEARQDCQWSTSPLSPALGADFRGDSLRGRGAGGEGANDIRSRAQPAADNRDALPNAATVRTLGERICRLLKDTAFPSDHPLVFLTQENLGKVLGNYVTEWGALPLAVVVIDEVPIRGAQYVHIGASRGGSVPVSFYGLNDPGDGT